MEKSRTIQVSIWSSVAFWWKIKWFECLIFHPIFTLLCNTGPFCELLCVSLYSMENFRLPFKHLFSTFFFFLLCLFCRRPVVRIPVGISAIHNRGETFLPFSPRKVKWCCLLTSSQEVWMKYTFWYSSWIRLIKSLICGMKRHNVQKLVHVK